MGPIADFSCLGPKCRTDEGAPVYADLPIASTRCPVCGSKRLQRLWNKAPGMIRPGMRPIMGLIDQAGAEAQAVANDGKDARLLALKRNVPALAVPINQVAGTLAQMGAGPIALAQGGSKPKFHNPAPASNEFAGRIPIAGPGSRRDTVSEKWLAANRPQARPA